MIIPMNPSYLTSKENGQRPPGLHSFGRFGVAVLLLAFLSVVSVCQREKGKEGQESPRFTGAEGIITLEQIMAGEVGKYVTLTPYPSACVRRLDVRLGNPPLISPVPFNAHALQKELGFAPSRSEEKSLFDGSPVYNDVLTWKSSWREKENQHEPAGNGRSSVTAVARNGCVYWVSAEFTEATPAEEVVAHVGAIPLTRDFHDLVNVLGAPSVSSGPRLRTFRCQWSIVTGTAPERVFLVLYVAVKDMLIQSMFVNLFYESRE